MDSAVNCYQCNTIIDAGSTYCKNCGTHRPVVKDDNFCSNSDCEKAKQKFVFKQDDNYCDICGKPTTRYKCVHDFLNPY